MSSHDDMVLIDFALKGNVVRLFLGMPGVSPWGDDWNDVPYEHNAGEVYPEYVAGYVDIAFDFDAIVAEPCVGYSNSPWSKDDMLKRRTPCLAAAVLDESYNYWVYEYNFSKLALLENAFVLRLFDEITFGDESFLPDFAHVISWHRDSFDNAVVD